MDNEGEKPGEYALKEVPFMTGEHLVATGEAMDYSVRKNPVYIHHKQYVVEAGGKYYLVPVTELSIVFIGFTRFGEKNKAMYSITLPDGHPLGPLLMEDMKSIGFNITAPYGAAREE